MARDDCFVVDLPSEFAHSSVSDLLDLVFPDSEKKRQEIASRFDLRANPDLPDIYAVLLAVCEEWRDSRCALVASSDDGDTVRLDDPATVLLDHDTEPASLSLHLEQEYRALDYAVRRGRWDSREELLEWLRSLTLIYFLDKHEVRLEFGRLQNSGPALARSTDLLRSQGLVSREDDGKEDEKESDQSEPFQADRFVITPEGRRFIGGLLAETESYIDQYDHFQDALVDPDREGVEFGTGRGHDLRVQAFLADELDPIRTVFLLRLYDGTLDARLGDWTEVIEGEDFFDAVLEPAVNRDGVDLAAMEWVLESGQEWLDDRQEETRHQRQQREILRRARGDSP